MNETLSLVLSLVTGALLGSIFFGGLWWTVRKALSSNEPAPWLLLSTLLRMCIVLVGFYFISRGHWERLVVCLVGFVIARAVITRLTRLPETPTYTARDVRHAP